MVSDAASVQVGLSIHDHFWLADGCGGGGEMTIIAPCTIRRAKEWIKQTHRHLPMVNGGLFAVALESDSGALLGVAMAGHGPQEWQGTKRLIITRVAVADDVKNGCSRLYGAICRAGKALGYIEAWTYTLPEESGTSLRAAGFQYMGMTDGGDHGRSARPRKPAVRPEPKHRWRRIL